MAERRAWPPAVSAEHLGKEFTVEEALAEPMPTSTHQVGQQQLDDRPRRIARAERLKACGIMSAPIVIREAMHDDINAVLSLWGGDGIPASRTDDTEALTAVLDHPTSALFVGEVAGAVVGSIIAAWDGWRAELYRLAVAESHRRTGVATRLVHHAEGWLLERGAEDQRARPAPLRCRAPAGTPRRAIITTSKERPPGDRRRHSRRTIRLHPASPEIVASVGYDERGEPVYPPRSIVRTVTTVGDIGYRGVQITIGPRSAHGWVRVIHVEGVLHTTVRSSCGCSSTVRLAPIGKGVLGPPPSENR